MQVLFVKVSEWENCFWYVQGYWYTGSVNYIYMQTSGEQGTKKEWTTVNLNKL